MATHPRTTDLQDLLDNADPGSLRTFLLTQVRRNLTLEIKLRSFLVKETDISSDANKYSEILSLLVHHDVHGRVRLSKRNLQLLRDVCDHFVAIQQKLLASTGFKEAWDASISVISSLNLYLDKNPGQEHKLGQLLTSSYKSVYELIHQNPAPELRQRIFSVLHEISGRSNHKIYDIRYNAITCLIPSALDQDDLEELRQLVMTRINLFARMEQTQRKMWLALLLRIPRFDANLRATIPPEDVYDIAHLLSAAGDLAALSRLLNEFTPPGSLTRPQLAQWARWKFDLAIRTGEQEQVVMNGIELLLIDGDIKVYQKIKSLAGSRSLLAKIDDLDISDSLRAEIYAEEHQWSGLISLIHTKFSLPLLIQHCNAILDYAQDPGALIIEVVHNFVLHTGGASAAVQIQRLIDVLKQLKHKEIAEHLREHLLQEFPGRFSEIQRRFSLSSPP